MSISSNFFASRMGTLLRRSLRAVGLHGAARPPRRNLPMTNDPTSQAGATQRAQQDANNGNLPANTTTWPSALREAHDAAVANSKKSN